MQPYIACAIKTHLLLLENVCAQFKGTVITKIVIKKFFYEFPFVHFRRSLVDA
jgi:hypothetical protein